MQTQDAIRGVIGAFESANLVALGERHWAREDSDFRLKLIRDASFAQTVNDVVVEFANPLYQDRLDRHINGEAIPPADLRKLWQDTTQPGAWDSPVYEAFLEAVRQANAPLPDARRIRVLAGDQPMDWSHSHEPAWKDERDTYAASVIEREVLRRGRKALVIFGSAHTYRKRPGTIVDILRPDSKATWFVIVPVSGPDLPGGISATDASPTNPDLLLLSHSAVGRLCANDVFERGTMRVKLVDGKPLLVDGKPVFVPAQVFEPDLEVRQVADACLYFGSTPPESVPPPAELYRGTEYGKEVQRRRALMFGLR